MSSPDKVHLKDPDTKDVVHSAEGVVSEIPSDRRGAPPLQQSDFLATLAHELRNPLAAISNAATLMMRPEEEHRLWGSQVIKRQIGTLAALVDDLLDVARINQGKIQLQKKAVEVRVAIERATESVRPLLDERRHQVSLSLPSTPIFLSADQVRLVQVLTNLLTNAAKYSDDDSVICVSASVKGEHCQIEIKDDGVGIDPALLPHIFDMYTQAEEVGGRSRGGLGTGLALVRKFVELHGGSVTCVSEGRGKGATFTVWLPAMRDLPSPVPEPASREITRKSGSCRILVVDDDVDTASGMCKLLEASGHCVVMASNGGDAIALARTFSPDAVVLDVGLPGGKDGYQIAKILRDDECCAKAVLIALSGYGREQDLDRSRRVGIDHYLVKPIDPDRLIELLPLCR